MAIIKQETPGILAPQNLIQKNLTISLIGKPNAGKSTLLNKLIGQKISIVTPKVQTTRTIITGITTIKDTQLIFYDTPGIFSAKRTLEKAMIRSAWSSVNEVDIVALLINISKKSPIDNDTLNILRNLESMNIKPIILLNKVDIAEEENYQEIMEHQYIKDRKVFCISALKGTNCDALLKYFLEHAKDGPWLYEEDEVTTAPMKFIASEITREKIFLNLEQELPYNINVVTDSWSPPLKDGSVKVHQTIVISRESHKPIILGNKGTMIKRIGSQARQEINKLLDIKVHLFLHIKVKEDWQEKPGYYNEIL